jgi:hypothetical protein
VATIPLADIPEEIENPMPAPREIVDVAQEIRDAQHPDIDGARIAYVLVPGAEPVEGKRIELGRARKVSKIVRLLTDTDFIISLNWLMWQQLDDAQQKALLDHELTHCVPDINAKGDMVGWKIRKHDVEDFVSVIDRHGLWTRDLEVLGEHMRQLNLFEKKAAS